MDNLTVGQRIDVYEVVDDIPNGEGYNHHGVSIGTVFGVNKIKHSYTYQVLPVNESLPPFRFYEVKACGYYLKVKSLKGGSNELL